MAMRFYNKSSRTNPTWLAAVLSPGMCACRRMVLIVLVKWFWLPSLIPPHTHTRFPSGSFCVVVSPRFLPSGSAPSLPLGDVDYLSSQKPLSTFSSFCKYFSTPPSKPWGPFFRHWFTFPSLFTGIFHWLLGFFSGFASLYDFAPVLDRNLKPGSGNMHTTK